MLALAPGTTALWLSAGGAQFSLLSENCVNCLENNSWDACEKISSALQIMPKPIWNLIQFQKSRVPPQVLWVRRSVWVCVQQGVWCRRIQELSGNMQLLIITLVLDECDVRTVASVAGRVCPVGMRSFSTTRPRARYPIKRRFSKQGWMNLWAGLSPRLVAKL